jgi:hypothetical protein
MRRRNYKRNFVRPREKSTQITIECGAHCIPSIIISKLRSCCFKATRTRLFVVDVVYQAQNFGNRMECGSVAVVLTVSQPTLHKEMERPSDMVMVV